MFGGLSLEKEEKCVHVTKLSTHFFFSWPMTSHFSPSLSLSVSPLPAISLKNSYNGNADDSTIQPYAKKKYVDNSHLLIKNIGFISSFSFSLFCCLLIMVTLPTFDHDIKHDAHAPASTYYTTGDNARQRTRTYTVCVCAKISTLFMQLDQQHVKLSPPP